MNIVLIGMSGVGKSLIGEKLAKELGYSFIDVDELIEQKTEMKLRDIIDNFGDEKFLEIEEKTILDLNLDLDLNLNNESKGVKENQESCVKENYVIAPGGSIIYSKKAIEHLKKNSIFVFLDASLENLELKLKDIDKRGIVYLKEKSYEEIFKERLLLYKKYSDISIKTDGLSIKQSVRKIKQSLKLKNKV